MRFNNYLNQKSISEKFYEEVLLLINILKPLCRKKSRVYKDKVEKVYESAENVLIVRNKPERKAIAGVAFALSNSSVQIPVLHFTGIYDCLNFPGVDFLQFFPC